MKEFSLFLPCEPISVNQCERSGKNGQRYKSKEYNEFRQNIWPLLASHRNTLKQIGEDFIHGEHFFNVAYTFGIPREKFFTKSGKISKTSGDVDNFIKPVNDLVFKSMEFFNQNINDGLVLMVGAKKTPAKKHFISVNIYLDSYRKIH